MPLSLSQRSVTLGFLLLVCVGATALLGMTATGQSPDLTLAPVAAFTLAFYVLAAVYWRGWEPARYLTVIASSLAIGLEMPAVNFTGPTIPQSVLLPAVVALLLADSRWVVVNTLLTGGLLLWRAEGQGALVQPSNLITLVVTVGGLLLSRAMLDQARRQAEANARQARAQAEEVQRKNDSIRFQAELLDNVGQAVIAVLFDGRIIYRNPAARGFYGWAEEEAAAVGIDALLPGELSAEARAAIRAALRRGEAWTGEALMRRRDGSPLPVLAKLTPLREAGRQVVGWVAVAADLSERHQMENELRASEARYRSMVEALPDGVAETTPQGVILSANPRLAEMLGAAGPEHLIGMNGRRFIAAADQASASAQLFGPGPITDRDFGLFTFQPVTGAAFLGELSVRVITAPGGPPARLVFILRDLTERRRIEAALDESEARFRFVVEQATEAVWLIDAAGLIVEFNPAAERLTGLTRVEALGQAVWDMQARLLVPERRTAENAARFREITLAALESGQAPFLGRLLEGVLQRVTGDCRNIEQLVFLIRSKTGNRLLTITHDVTDRRQAAAEIQRLNAELEQRVAERTRQLEAANRELEAFSYSVSHDLRAPLRHIDGFGQILEEDYASRLDDQGRQYLAYLRQGARHMNTLIEGLLNLSRVVRGDLRRERVDLSALAENIAAELRGMEPQRAATFIIAPGLTAEADERLARSLLQNLLGNAWKYTAKQPAARIEFGAWDLADKGPVWGVRDNGAGFDMAYADRLFGVFQRLHSEQEYPGMGIGLATVQRIVRRHGGQVWAEGAVGQGAAFYFTLAPAQPRPTG